MADTETVNMKFIDQTSGGNNSTWGTITDENWAKADAKLGSTTSVSTTGGNTTLSETQERVMAVDVSGVLVSNATIILSGRGGEWIFRNQTSGAFSVTAKVSGQTGVVVAQSTATLVWCNGTDLFAGVPTADLVADTSPQLGADLDANAFSIQFDDATGIEDDSGNEQVRFQKTASAVNQIDVTNAATGNSPRIDATGDDTNIDLTLAGKGTGGVVGAFKQSTGLGLYDSDSSHALQLKTSSNLSATRQLDFITGDANRNVTLAANLNVSGTAEISGTHTGTASGTNTGDEPSASDTAEGLIEIAVQSEMEAASSALLAVTPGRQHLHPGHPKCWAVVTVAAGTPTLQTSYNVTSIADTATGRLTVTIATDFSTANWACLVSVQNSEVGDLNIVQITAATLAAGSVEFQCQDSDDGTDEDPTSWHFVGLGDQ